MEVSELSVQVMRWRMRLGEFDFDVNYKKHLLNTYADALFWLSSLREAATPVDKEILTYPLHSDPASSNLDVVINVDKLLAATTATTPSLVSITFGEYRLEESYDHFSRAKRAFICNRDSIYYVLNVRNVLFHSIARFGRILISHFLVARVLHLSHHSEMAGHPGGRCLYQFYRRNFFS